MKQMKEKVLEKEKRRKWKQNSSGKKKNNLREVRLLHKREETVRNDGEQQKGQRSFAEVQKKRGRKRREVRCVNIFFPPTPSRWVSWRDVGPFIPFL
mmetsp:Transcript_48575/g.95855  ORF Transcript_48575/g.95855 Transcript_48575/m.95855 type:complete len:97 (-) Transcript_48575:1298-1588(-)